MSLASVFSRPFSRAFASPRMGCLALGAAALLLGSSGLAKAQTPGSIDPNFLSQLSGGTIYSLYRYDYVDVTGVPQDYLVVAGDTDVFGRITLPQGILNSNDTKPDFGNLGRITFVLAQDKYRNPDKFFVGGAFGLSTTQKTPRQNIYRLNPDFSLDDAAATDGRPIFDPGQGANAYVTSILPTADGKLVVAGLFTEFNNIAHLHIVRLTDDGTADGSIDPTFAPNLAFDDNVLALAEQLSPATGQPNGQILVGGLFSNVNSTPAGRLSRINNDGSVDTTFKPVFDQRVNTIAVQPDGKIVLGGDFLNVNGQAAQHLVRLNFDGSIDPTFSAGVAQVPSNNVNVVSVYTIVLLTDGRMYVGGNFITCNGTPRQYLALLNANGSVDPTFDPGVNIVNAVQTIVPDTISTGDVFVGETRNPRINGNFPPSLIALYPPPVNTPAFSNAPAITRVSQFFNGEQVVGGGFYSLNFPNTPADNVFGTYFLEFYPIIYHDDLGFEYVIDANDGQNGIYLYDYASGTFFYTSPTYAFPYLYDFSLHSVLFYYPVGDANPGHYTSNPRYFYDFATGQIITK